MSNTAYETPLGSRYASREMLYLFSPDHKFTTWRKLWIALAETEKELGLNITQEQIDQMKTHVDDIDYENARRHEERVRHDVMAHVHAYGDVCPDARGIIHLGATSCYVTDNTDILILRDGLAIIRKKLLETLRRLRAFALEYRDMPTLGLTHLQPAQLVTVGKRAALWMQDLLMDVNDLDDAAASLKMLGSRGTTGTQASFMALFDGDEDKVKALDQRIAEKMGLPRVFPVSGQTYPRKVDSRVLSVLSGVAQSAYKFAQDLRLLQHMREIEEPFEKNQIGSSAMAYTRNPMRCERICSLSRYLMTEALNAPLTAAAQWLERTLDDSANRRLSLPESFLCADAVLRLLQNVSGGLRVNEKIVDKTVREYLPFIATENLLMEAVKRGGDRQQLHEIIRRCSMEATARMKDGGDCDLLSRLAACPEFGMSEAELEALLEPCNYTGRCEQQVEAFLSSILPVLNDVVLTETTLDV